MRLQVFKLKAVFEKTNLQRLIFAAFFLVSGFLALGAAEAIQAQPKASGKTKQINQVLEAEQILSNLGYWITKVDSVADSSTRHALVAFQKVEGRKRTGVLNSAELQALRKASRPSPKSGGGTHIEIDLSRQVLFLVDENGTVTRILPVSSGNEKKYFDQGMWQVAHTPRGNFTITRRINGVRHSTLGALYYPNYFTGGVAIHGSGSIPVYPASHGCVRIPNFAAKSFFDLVSIGTPVLVYD